MTQKTKTANATESAALAEIKAELARLRTDLQALREAVAAMKRIESQPPQPDVPTDYPHIVRVIGVRSGRPIVRGTGISVEAIVELFKLGYSPERIVEHYVDALNLSQVYDALAYYHAHCAEIESYFEKDNQTEEEFKRSQRERVTAPATAAS